VSVLPVYLALVIPGAQSLLVVRSLRLLRVFRVFKMAHWLNQANYLLDAVRASTRKIMVFLLTVVLINVVVGSTMYVVEGAANGFDSMFRGVYWSIVTMSTVGFGDIAPQTALGQVLASMLMILGYGVIAVPTGIVSAEMTAARRPGTPVTACPASRGGRPPLDGGVLPPLWDSAVVTGAAARRPANRCLNTSRRRPADQDRRTRTHTRTRQTVRTRIRPVLVPVRRGCRRSRRRRHPGAGPPPSSGRRSSTSGPRRR